MQSLNSFIPSDNAPDYHAVYSMQLCELVNSGFKPFGDKRWNKLDWYSKEIKSRLEDKILARYWYREIGIFPAGEWRHELTRVMGEILPKYNVLYAAVSNGSDILADSDTYSKERTVYSDFPATQLNESINDYARNAQDKQNETVVQGNYLEKAADINSRYNDIDVMILDQLEVCFSCLASVTFPVL